jgi:hypothetical protein
MTDSDLITPGGVFRGRTRGIASGMSFTNLMDSLIQYVLFEYTVLYLDIKVKVPLPSFQGDDGVWPIPGLNPVLLSSIMSQFNIVCNSEKLSYSLDYFTYCQRLYLRSYKIDGFNVGIRSAYRTINSIISFERRRKNGWTGAHDSVRVMMQLIGCSNNPIHDALVKALVKADVKYGLGIKHPEGLGGLFKEAGDLETVIQLSGGSSWDRTKYRELTSNLLKLRTIRVILALYQTTK